MSRLASIQNKIEAKIFQGIGSDGTLETVNSKVQDKWGDETIIYNSPVAIKIVPYNLIDYSRSYLPFGDLGKNETDSVVPYGTVFAENDRITVDGKSYKIINIEKFPFTNGNLAYAIRLVKQK